MKLDGKRSSFWCVKSIITILIVATFCIMVIINPEKYSTEFMCIASSVITWYFSYQNSKNKKETGDDVNEGN